jgi:hypothetical protein
VAELAYFDVARLGESAVTMWAELGGKIVEEAQAAGRLKSLSRKDKTPEALALRYLKGAADRKRDAAAGKGSAVHGWCESIVRENVGPDGYLVIPDHGPVLAQIPEELRPYVSGFLKWNDLWLPRFVNVEFTVYSREFGYAGTSDALVMIWCQRREDGELVPGPREDGRVVRLPHTGWARSIVDFKTGNLYEEAALQVASYAKAEFIGLPDGSELPMPKVDHAALLYLKEDGSYEFRWVPGAVSTQTLDSLFEFFKIVAGVAYYRAEVAGSVIGKPVKGETNA